MGMPHLDFTQSYEVTGAGVVPTTPRPPHPLMVPMFERLSSKFRRLSPVAKVGVAGDSVQAHEKEMPRVEIAARIIAMYQNEPPVGTNMSRGNEFPYGLRAVGYVDPYQIATRQGSRLVASNFELVP